MDKDTKVLLRITFRTELRLKITKLLKTPQITQITCLFFGQFIVLDQAISIIKTLFPSKLGRISPEIDWESIQGCMRQK